MAFCLLVSLCLAPLLTIPTDGSPVRFGVRVAAGALDQGLSLAGEGVLQWRRLPIGDAAVQPERYVWIEVAIVAPRGVARVMRGGAGPCVGGRGPAYVRTQEDRPAPGGRVSCARCPAHRSLPGSAWSSTPCATQRRHRMQLRGRAGGG